MKKIRKEIYLLILFFLIWMCSVCFSQPSVIPAPFNITEQDGVAYTDP